MEIISTVLAALIALGAGTATAKAFSFVPQGAASRKSTWAAAVGAIVIGVAVFWLLQKTGLNWISERADYATVFALGSLVAAGEIVSRYRDDPVSALRSRPGEVYVLLGGVISAAALFLT